MTAALARRSHQRGHTSRQRHTSASAERHRANAALTSRLGRGRTNPSSLRIYGANSQVSRGVTNCPGLPRT